MAPHLPVLPDSATESDSVDTAPVTFPQHGRLRFLTRKSSFGAPLVRAFSMEAPFRRQTLERALSHIAVRHDSLRMAFARQNGEYVSVVRPDAAVPILEFPHGSVESVIDGPLSASWDLDRPPLLRCGVLHADGPRFVLMLAADHLIVDNWAIDLLSRELLLAYNALADGREVPAEISGPGPSFQEWSRQERARLVRDDTLVERWRDKLGPGGLFPTLSFVDGSLAKGKLSVASLSLSGAPLASLLRRWAEHRTTYSSFVLGLLAHSLAVKADVPDPVVGYVESGRMRSHEMAMAGWLSADWPLRVRVDAATPPGQCLAEARDSILCAMRNRTQMYLLVRALRPELDGESGLRMPPRITLNLQAGNQWVMPAATPLPLAEGYGNRDGLHVLGNLEDDRLELTFVHNERTCAATIRRVVSHLEEMVTSFAEGRVPLGR
jgi:hypothetical protein